MKICRTLALALMVAVPAAAQAQINLAWNDCITQSTAAENLHYACDGSASSFKLVPSFILPGNRPEFAGLEMYIDIQQPSTGPLPDYWRLGVGGCREGSLTYPAAEEGVGTGTAGACQSPWLGQLRGGAYQFNMDYLGNPGAARLLTVYAITPPRELLGGQQYHAGVITFEIGDVQTEGQTSCDGCCQPVTITLTSMEVDQIGPLQFDILTTPGIRNTVTWNANGCEGPGTTVPTRRSSWGAVKATYR